MGGTFGGYNWIKPQTKRKDPMSQSVVQFVFFLFASIPRGRLEKFTRRYRIFSRQRCTMKSSMQSVLDRRLLRLNIPGM